MSCQSFHGSRSSSSSSLLPPHQVVKALNFVCDAPADKDKIGADTKLAFFNETR